MTLRLVNLAFLAAALSGIGLNIVLDPGRGKCLANTTLIDRWAGLHPASLDWLRDILLSGIGCVLLVMANRSRSATVGREDEVAVR